MNCLHVASTEKVYLSFIYAHTLVIS